MTAPDFEANARDPQHWQRTAREFALAANYLGDWYDSDPAHADMTSESRGTSVPMMVLYAISVENLLKAIKVARGHDPVSSGQLSKDFANHDLVGQAKDAGIALTASQSELLVHLRSVIESGKYPVAKSPQGNPTAWTLRFPADVEQVWSLLELLEFDLAQTGKSKLPTWDFRKRYRPIGYPKL